MNSLTAVLGISALFAGLGIVYFSRLLLRKYPKVTGAELESLHPELEGIFRTYWVFSTVTLFSVGFCLFLIYELNRAFWEERVVVLFVPIFSAFTLLDALFALRTKVFPTTSRLNMNSYVYDRDDQLHWVAFWQTGLSILLMVFDGVILLLTL